MRIRDGLSRPGAPSTIRIAAAFPPARLGLRLPLQSDPLSFLMLGANRARNAVFTQAPLQLTHRRPYDIRAGLCEREL